MQDIQQKLDKYNNSFVYGEKRSSEYEQKIRQEQRLKRRKQIAINMKYEAKPLVITDTHVEQVQHLITIFNDKFKKLYANGSEDMIILAFFLYCLKIDDSRIKIANYRVFKKYNLTEAAFGLIVSRMLNFFMKQMPVAPIQTTKYDQDYLYRNHGV